MMNKKLFFIFILSCFCMMIFAQERSSLSDANTPTSDIRAIVIDSLENDTLVAAAVGLYAIKDSALVKVALTDKNGEFVLKDIKPSLYYLQIRFLGYAPLVVHIPEDFFSSTEINLGNLNMRFATFEMEEVVIMARIPEFIIKEDTIEYNAAAFRTEEGAVLEELLKQLPGLEVSEGGGITTVDGKRVSRVFVNDKEFFGNDPNMATKNLPANIVDKVQLIEKKSDTAILTGVEDDNRETVINIKIKKGMFGGWIGNASAGAGRLIDNPTNASTLYSLQSTLNRFNEDNQTSITVRTNNLNQQGSSVVVSSGGLVGLVGLVSVGGGSGGSGITKSSSVGINHNQQINKKIEAGGSVSYNYLDRYSSNKSFSQNFLRSAGSSEIDSTFYVRKATSNQSYSNSYSFSGFVTYKDSLTTVNFRPSISFNSSRSGSNSEQKTMGGDVDSTLINESNSTDFSNSNGSGIQMQLTASRKLSDLGRRVSLSGNFNMNRSEGDGTKVSTNEFYNSMVENEYIDQLSTSKSNSYSYSINASYVEPFSKTKSLNFSYSMNMNNSNSTSNALNYDEHTGDYARRNAKYSRTSELMSVNQNVRVNFTSNKEKYNYNIGLSVTPNNSQNKIFVKDWFGVGLDSLISSVDDRKVVNISPSMNFSYRMGKNIEKQKNLRFQYAGSTRHPTDSQLSASDNTNPLNIILGNPDLIPAFSNNLSLGYTHNNRKTLRAVTFNGSFSFTMNDIITYINYHDGGTMTTTYINQNGNWNTSGTLTFATPFGSKKKLRLNTSSNYSFRHNVGYSRVSNRDENNNTVLSSEKTITKTSTMGQTVSLNFTNKWYSGQMRANINYNKRNNTLNSTSSVETYNYGISNGSQFTLPYKISLSSNINWNANKGLSSGYNRNEALWNVQAGRTLLKGKGTISLQLNDILRQRRSISHSESAYSIQDSESIVLTSYYMLTFSYRFNKIGSVKSVSTMKIPTFFD